MLSQYLRLFTQTGNLPDGNDNNPPDPMVDVSLANQDGEGIILNFNYLYIAQHYPFTNLFMLMDVFNSPLPVVPIVAIQTPYNAIGPVDEVQTISFPLIPTSGSFKLKHGTDETSSIAYNANASDVETALRALPTLSTVTVTYLSGVYTVTFVGIATPSLLVCTPNNLVIDNPSKFKIEYWDGTSWQEAVDVMDGSNGLYKNGMIHFSRKNKYSWCEITETDDDTTGIPKQLVGLYINNCYWMRVSPITTGIYKTPNPITKIKRICYAFTTTTHVNSVDMEGPSYYQSIDDSGNKADWIPEIIHASEEMVLDLKRVGFIKSAGQIIELDELYLACAWKTLSHIYFQLGKAFEAQRAIMNNKYEKALSSRALSFDNDKDAKLDKKEINSTESKMIR